MPSKLQRHPKTTPPPPIPPTKPQLSMPTPPGQPPGRPRARGQSRKNKTHTRNVPTHKHGVRPGPPLCSTVILTRCLGPGSGHPADSNHRISDISLRPPPSTTSTPPLWSHWECFVKTQRRRARPVVRYIKRGEHDYEAGWPLGAPGGLISTEPSVTPPRGKRHVVLVRCCPL